MRTNIQIVHVNQENMIIFEYIEADFNLNLNINHINAKVSILNKEISINLIMKKYNENDKKHSMLCGKVMYSNDYIKYFDYWIQMLKLPVFAI